MRNLPDIDYSIVADEFNSLVRSLNKVVLGFSTDMRYFPVGHRGVYHTVATTSLNVAHMHRPGTMISVMRHEGMARCSGLHGRNNREQLHRHIHDQEKVPRMYE